MKKFLTKPLVIEDQGSFFIGGVPKVTDYATVPAPNRPRAAGPNQITIGQMYVQFQIPPTKKARHALAGDHGARIDLIRPRAWSRRRTAAKAGIRTFVRKGISTYIVDQAGRGRSGFDESVIHEGSSEDPGGDVAAADGHDSRLRPDHRQRRVDAVVRPPRCRRIDDPDRQADPPRRSRRSHRRRRAYKRRLHARVSARSRGSQHCRAHGAIGPAPAGPPAITTRSSTTSSWFRTPRSRCPGSICATCDPNEIAPANTWTPQDLAALVERLGGAIVVTHSQSGSWAITWPAS